jgi:hypothetical protein
MTESARNGHRIEHRSDGQATTTSGTETVTMSKKGRKAPRKAGEKGQGGRSRKKAAPGLEPVTAAAAVAEISPTPESPGSPATEAAPQPTPSVVDVPVVAAVVAEVAPTSKSLETPIAFEAPLVIEARVEAAPAEAARKAAHEADVSIPPVDLDSHFFSKPVHHDPVPEDHDEHEERDPRMVLKLTPAAAARRAQLQRYVKMAVGAASVLCLAALVKVAVAHNHEEPVVRRASASMQVAPIPVAAPVVAPQPMKPVDAIPPPPAPAETATAAAPEATVATATAPAAAPAPSAAAAPTAADPAPAAPADPTVATSTDTTAPTEPDPKAAAKEKHASQLALERGKAGEAIEAGERSVALDPGDAEAWLILGAAYQEKGDAANARRAFKSCLSESKRGPKWECAQFPH